MIDLERELESELHRALDPLAAMPVPLRRAARPVGYVQRFVGSAGAALALKVATGIAVAAAATTVAGAATTGSLNPTNWGEYVSTSVQSCKDDLRQSGERGIGECVSSIASTHGDATSDSKQHHGNPTGTGETGSGTSTSGSSSGHSPDKDKGKDHTQSKGK